MGDMRREKNPVIKSLPIFHKKFNINTGGSY